MRSMSHQVIKIAFGRTVLLHFIEELSSNALAFSLLSPGPVDETSGVMVTSASRPRVTCHTNAHTYHRNQKKIGFGCTI